MSDLSLDSLLRLLAGGADALSAALSGVSEEDARWRPPSGGWTMLEIVNHLADEEVEDFRTRIRSTLQDPERAWDPIDPEGDIRSRGYNRRDLAESLERFLSARRESMAWFQGLEDPDWSRAYEHPVIGTLRAGDLLASMVAHDALHLRQLAQRRFDLTQRDAGEFRTLYAGEW